MKKIFIILSIIFGFIILIMFNNNPVSKKELEKSEGKEHTHVPREAAKKMTSCRKFKKSVKHRDLGSGGRIWGAISGASVKKRSAPTFLWNCFAWFWISNCSISLCRSPKSHHFHDSPNRFCVILRDTPSVRLPGKQPPRLRLSRWPLQNVHPTTMTL